MQDSIFEYITKELKNNYAEQLYKEITELNDNELEQFKICLFNDTLEYIKSLIKPKEINNIYDLAKLLNNNSYYNELDNPYNIDIEEICKKNKWIILFPYSDDLLELRGYISDEIGAFNGGDYYLIKKGDFYEDTEEENTYHKSLSDNIIETSNKSDAHIFVKWCDDKYKPYIWYIDTDYTDVAYFDILDEDSEDYEIWAHCCVIDCSNIF